MCIRAAEKSCTRAPVQFWTGDVSAFDPFGMLRSSRQRLSGSGLELQRTDVEWFWFFFRTPPQCREGAGEGGVRGVRGVIQSKSSERGGRWARPRDARRRRDPQINSHPPFYDCTRFLPLSGCDNTWTCVRERWLRSHNTHVALVCALVSPYNRKWLKGDCTLESKRSRIVEPWPLSPHVMMGL